MLGERFLKVIMSWTRFLRFVTLSGLSETCKIGMHLRVYDLMVRGVGKLQRYLAVRFRGHPLGEGDVLER